MASLGISYARKFKVLTWKTLITKYRHYIETILDILVPSLLFIVLVVLRFKFEGLAPTQKEAETFDIKQPFDRLTWEGSDFPGLCVMPYSGRSQRKAYFLYTPLTKEANDTIQQFDTIWKSLFLQQCNKTYGNDETDYEKKWSKYEN